MKQLLFVSFFIFNVNCFSQQLGTSHGVGGDYPGLQRKFERFESVFYGRPENKKIVNHIDDIISWALLDRELSKSETISVSCVDKGRLVFQIKIDKKGNVVEANLSKGSTSSNLCLVEPALSIIKNYKWRPNKSAPESQIGFVVVNFK
ncbi:energy transducer TonB [Flavobacterium saliperosum]|uniref:TonB protein C-terminal n=1 Tax=Flavobacterium saliperosum TaxID=329186 RepID=A0A1G4VMH5_9FLAO|nr:hypothetical protein [Flavobacterium saliperosum]SCX09010.1 TonB protein C-terminal [Flavobacterium saliperosum]